MQMNHPIYNIAHRGARSLAPENTMPAFEKASQVGAHGIEADVSVTSDGELIIFHDETAARTTNVGSLFPHRKNDGLHTFTWKELGQLDAGSWFAQQDPFNTVTTGEVTREELSGYSGTPIPLLEELLEFTKRKGLFFNIEIKPLPREQENMPVVNRILAAIEAADLSPKSFAISSFHHPFLREIHQLRPELEINALIGGVTGMPQQWGTFDFAVYNANVDKIDALQLEEARNRGCRVNLYTVNRLEEMIHYLERGVEKIITDFPQHLSEWSRENQERDET